MLPEFTKGTELDKLRKVMEEKGIDRAIHKTAYKVGSHNMPGINIYAEGGKIEIPEDIKEGRAVLRPSWYAPSSKKYQLGRSKRKRFMVLR